VLPLSVDESIRHVTTQLQSGASCLDLLRRMNPSVRLIEDHMTPGIWIGAGEYVRVSADHLTGVHDEPRFDGRITVSKDFQLHDNLLSRVALSAEANGVANLFMAHSVADTLDLKVECNSKGRCLAGMRLSSNPQFLYQKENPFSVSIGSWVSSHVSKLESNERIEDGRLYAIVNGLGATAAVEASMDGEVSSMFSINLSDGDTPPIHLMLEKQASYSAMAVSQLLSFDREHFDPSKLAGEVRNRIGWCVRLEKVGEDSQMSAAAAWQLNRGLAIKGVLRPTSFTSALLLRRWKQPSVSVSLLHRYDWTTKSSAWLGFGLDLDSNPLVSQNNDFYDDIASKASFAKDDGNPTRRIRKR